MNIQQQELFILGEIQIRLPQGMAVEKNRLELNEWHIYDSEDRMIGGFAWYQEKKRNWGEWIRICPKLTEDSHLMPNRPSIEDMERARHIINEAISALNQHKKGVIAA